MNNKVIIFICGTQRNKKGRKSGHILKISTSHETRCFENFFSSSIDYQRVMWKTATIFAIMFLNISLSAFAYYRCFSRRPLVQFMVLGLRRLPKPTIWEFWESRGSMENIYTVGGHRVGQCTLFKYMHICEYMLSTIGGYICQLGG